jgi:enoyl-CoA hydratase/carnithine racemase
VADLLVRYETDGKVGIITLDRPAKLNAMNADLKDQLHHAFETADVDDTTSVVVLRAEGRSFCVGYDISGGDPSRAAWRNDALKWHDSLNKSLHFEMMPWYMRKPIIASVQGHAMGGGCELAMFCDLTICADNAVFGEPEIRFSSTGPGIVMPWIIGYKKARELLYFGDTIDAEAALQLGMVNRVVPLDQLREATLKYARRLALIAPEALMATKLSINRGADAAGFRNAMQAGLDIVAPLYAASTEVGEQFRAITAKEGVAAAVKWRRKQFEE